MSRRNARIEIVEADTQWYEETDEAGRVWSGKPPKSYRPHFLRLRASNGQILATSETYSNLTNARRAAAGWRRAFLQVGFAEAHGFAPVVEVTS